MTDQPECKVAYKRGYSNGYNAGAKWPNHRPPRPPDEHVAKLMAAVVDLRNRVDGYLATMPEDDESQSSLGDGIDAADAVLSAMGEWLKEDADD